MKHQVLIAFILLLTTMHFNHTVAAPNTPVNIKSINKDNTIEIDGRSYQLLGDMLILSEKLTTSRFDATKSQWTDGKVYFEFAADVTEANQLNFVEACKVWESVANLEFIERTDQTDYIYIQNDSKNYAVVGMVGGRQILSMANWGSTYVIVHELGHSLGMWHEQQRSDRDDYISILTENIQTDQLYNFTPRDTINHSDYDFLSTMHYPLTAWSNNGQPTMQAKAGYEKHAAHAGQRTHISGGDQVSAATQYGAKILNFSDQNFKSYLINHFDLNGDSEIDSLEAAQVREIHTPGQGLIQSVDGIQHFRYLEILDVSDENLKNLPPLPYRIESIDISHNQLESVQEDWVFPYFIENINASYNPLDVYACDSINFIQGSVGADALIINPLRDNSNLTCNDESVYQLVNGKPRTSLRSKGMQTFHINLPEGQTSLKIETTMSELEGGTMDVFVAFESIPDDMNFDHSSTNSGNDEIVEITNPQAGTWYVSLVPNERSFENVDLVASFDATPLDNAALQNGIGKTNVWANKGDELTFFLDVPENATNLRFEISGGEGDADLYVRFANEPTAELYDCRPWKSGNNETCEMSDAETGRYFVKLLAYSDFKHLELKASYQIQSTPVGGTIDITIDSAKGEWRYFSITLPDSMSMLTVSIEGGSGDGDLYIGQAYLPNIAQFDCRPYLDGNSESCEFSAPQSTKWYIGVRAYQAYSGLNLKAQWH